MGSPVQYWVKVVYVLKSNTGKRFKDPLSSTGKRLYRFTSTILGKGSVGFPVQYWEKVLGSPNPYWEKFQVPQSITGKIF